MNGRTVKCKICGEPYKFYPFNAADQSACPSCVAKAEANMRKARAGVQPLVPHTDVLATGGRRA